MVDVKQVESRQPPTTILQPTENDRLTEVYTNATFRLFGIYFGLFMNERGYISPAPFLRLSSKEAEKMLLKFHSVPLI